MSNKVTVKIKKLHPDAVIPQYAHKGDAGFDLVAAEDVIIAPGETKAIPLGLAFEIPEGYEMQIRPRSGISSKTKLRVSNAPGTVDCTYRGEVKVLLDHTKCSVEYSVRCLETLGGEKIEVCAFYPHETYLISKGDRIAQGVIQRLPDVELIETNELSDSERGAGGFGSSGVKA